MEEPFFKVLMVKSRDAWWLDKFLKYYRRAERSYL